MTPLFLSLAFVMEFVRGDKLSELPVKTVTVIEFSGTQCGPCIR